MEKIISITSIPALALLGTEVLKRAIKLRSRVIPLVSLLLGVLASLLVYSALELNANLAYKIVYGLIAGGSASGFWTYGKKIKNQSK